ncbi:hypothetical protein FD754_007889, partial [Muntiacus muntjak]
MDAVPRRNRPEGPAERPPPARDSEEEEEEAGMEPGLADEEEVDPRIQLFLLVRSSVNRNQGQL